MARCLVLGGNGFVGSYLVEALVEAGHQPVVFERPQILRIAELEKLDQVTWIEGDFVNAEALDEALDGCEYVFHLISTTLPKSSNDNPIYDVDTNLRGTLALLDAMVKRKARKVIFVSSGGTVYGTPRSVPITETHPTEPLCSYGITKLAIEKYLHLYYVLHGLDYAVLRLSNPFGERQRFEAKQGAIAVFLGHALRGEPIEIWGDGSVVRDYIYVADAARALIAAMGDTDGDDRVFNIGSGEGRSLNQVLDAIETVLDRPVERRYLAGRSFDVPVSVLDIERAKRSLSWRPQVPFEDGLKNTVAWLRTTLATDK
ncbi:UDP-glucose 4-epimerase [Burkholderia multivorans]|uniref:NAD-dependent epimerase/dehydratase family protein n=1 Tax=Burkholderia multivorans TaxID=87883 RepID=UPI0006A5A91C|nr:NAD-dependent epimerase/dehydratase family protein [Burkholderia multivorans]KOE25707.1 NAD-dependent epimerase [Burkholderia multivorans R-20526]MBU9242323.1 NAD-dependent epimerase/dehydratase family protein [Burkholderia multivorans]MCO7333095.1 NAD-dependent epimerase/dehydratase family protein [Burkholderia multivorans]MCO7339524.1 NAD-dependent epimerase/dehydratase family protein [Burkholderia multivorans]MCO7345576.1 NAD-dependent epimerase/dehydratase family protein [Burkholderia m